MVFDVIIILLISLFAFIGYKRKASGALVGLCVYIAAAVLSVWI